MGNYDDGSVDCPSCHMRVDSFDIYKCDSCGVTICCDCAEYYLGDEEIYYCKDCWHKLISGKGNAN